jgi:transcription antitermination factor NusG
LLASPWYVVHTLAHHEKQVAGQMQARCIEHFLPLYRCLRRWSDRTKELHLPLFPGYLFVRAPVEDRLRILQLAGVARLVSFQGTPAPVPEGEIQSIRQSLRAGLCLEPYPYLALGRRVRVHSGPLAGCEGILLARQRRLRLVLSINLIQRSLAVEVSADVIEPLPGRGGGDRSEQRDGFFPATQEHGRARRRRQEAVC